MTVNEVKRDLPMVRARWAGRRYWARVSGRLCDYACVSPYQVVSPRRLVGTIMGPCFHVSWEAVARAVSNDAELDLD